MARQSSPFERENKAGAVLAEEKASLSVPANDGELANVHDFINAELDRRMCPARSKNQLDIAVEELFVNVCHYAYEGMDAAVERSVCVRCSYSDSPRSVTVEIIDNGKPYDPLAKPEARKGGDYEGVQDIPIGGLGILMAKKNVDEMRYERVGDSNVVTLVKRW